MNKTDLSILSLLLASLLLTACQTSKESAAFKEDLSTYKVLVTKNGSDQLNEKDRQDCLDLVKAANLNVLGTKVVAYRRCLIDKGYVLLS